MRLPGFVGAFALAAALTAGLFLIEGDVGISLSDEGFLWYGAVRTAQGDVPMRDFQSYDPGRYYWSAAWFRLVGDDGIRSLRVSLAILQALALGVGLLAARRVAPGWPWLALTGAALLLWQVPRYKAFEAGAALAAVLVAVRLVERPSIGRHFVAGLFAGATAFFGRNHGLYCALALGALAIVVHFRIERGDIARRLGALCLGIGVGYLPMLVMLAMVPGFLHGFVELNMVHVRNRATNYSPGVAWPWEPESASLGALEAASVLAFRSVYLVMPLFYGAAAFLLLRGRRAREQALLLASVFVGGVYLHYAFSRFDLSHLAPSAGPLVLGLVAAAAGSRLGRVSSIALGAVLVAVSLLAAGTRHPGYHKLRADRAEYRRVRIGRDLIWVQRRWAALIETMQRIEERKLRGDPILVAPLWVTLYPLLQAKAPLWHLIFVYPDTAEDQQAMIERLRRERVRWAMVCDTALDRRQQERFSSTHSLLWRHFKQEWDAVDSDLPGNCKLLQRSAAGEGG